MCAAAAVVQSPMRSLPYIGQDSMPLVSSNESGGSGSRLLSMYRASLSVRTSVRTGSFPSI